MRSWQLVALCLAPLLPPAAVVLALEPARAVPAIGAALALLAASALAVDHFGIAFAVRRAVLGRVARDRRVAWRRARRLWRRFELQREAGAPRAERTARLLLVALAGCGRTVEAGEVADFLAGDDARRRAPERRSPRLLPAGRGPYR